MPGPRTATVDLALPPDLSPAALLAALAGEFDLDCDPPVAGTRTYLDTVDGRVRAAGLVVERTRSRGRGRLHTVTMFEPGRPAHSVEVAVGRPDRLLAADLPPGPLRDRLAPVIDVRALLPQARVTTYAHAARILNRDEKTVVRLSIEEATVGENTDAVVLTSRVHVQPVLGYDRAHRQACEMLAAKVNLRPAATTLVDEAVTALGGTPGGVSAKIDVRLRPDMRADAAMVAICTRLADIAEANLPGTLADLDTEFLHDLRVAVRRTRSVVREIKGVLTTAERERAREDLRWVQAITGPTRDLDVQLLDWPALVSGLSADAAADLAPLHALLARHRDAAWRTMCRQLKSARFTDAWTAWRDVVKCVPVGLVGPGNRERPAAALAIRDVAGRRIASVYRDMVTEGEVIDDDSPPELLHDLRKRGKELRYLLEHFGKLWPSATVSPMVTTLKALQDVLGRFQDFHIQATYLRSLGPELAAGDGGPDALIALGLVIDRLAAEERAARAAFAERFAPFASRANRRLVKATYA